MAKKLDLKDVGNYRKASGLNQSQFWNRFGVTQSGGSRYETGRNLPRSVAMLVWLRDKNRITDQDLEDALKAIKKA
jgi:transcriptional regulator with XRE-family HTH domain